MAAITFNNIGRCYLCYDRAAEVYTPVSKVPVCGRCADVLPAVEVPPRVDKAPPLSSSGTKLSTLSTFGTAYGMLYPKAWALGGCILCGSAEPRPAGNKMSHGECYKKASPELVHIALETLDKLKKE